MTQSCFAFRGDVRRRNRRVRKAPKKGTTLASVSALHFSFCSGLAALPAQCTSKVWTTADAFVAVNPCEVPLLIALRLRSSAEVFCLVSML